MRVSRRILLHVALGVFFVVAVVTAVTYWLVFDALKQSGLRQLDTYVAQRAEREEARFQQVQSNLKLVRGQFLRRLESPMAAGFLDKWDYWYELFPDGAWRSRKKFADARKFSSMWADKEWPGTPQMRRETLIAQELCDEMLEGWVDAFPSYYFQFLGPLNVGVDTYIPTWAWDMPAHFEGRDLEWVQLALPDKKPEDPDRFSWTGLQQDDVVPVPLVCVYLPILYNGEFLGSVGHNLSMESTLDGATRSEIPGASHFIFRPDGRLIAHATKRKEIVAGKGYLLAQDCGDPVAASLYRIATSNKERRFAGFDPVSDVYYSVAQLAGPEWHYVTTMPRDYLQQQAFASAKWVLWSGLISLALALGFIAIILRKQIARPLAELSGATEAMSAGATEIPMLTSRADELGELASSFREMSEKVNDRERELRQLNVGLEHRVTERTEELAQANRRLEESLKVEKELSELRANFVSLVSHEFRTPLEVILTSSDILDRYLDRLTPERRGAYLRTIHESVKRMGGMMEDVLLLGRVEEGKLLFKPEPLNLSDFCRRVTDEMLSATSGRCPITLDVSPDLGIANADEGLLRHIFANLLSNAAKYSPHGSPVKLRVIRKEEEAIITIADHGRGIPADDSERLFQSFQRGSNVSDTPGTGLGLLIVKKCVDIHGGTISFVSEEGRGTTFTITLPLFAAQLSQQ